jgi:enoyl-CoA hydratase/carnithine racemase
VYSEPGVNLLVDELGESIARAMLLAGRVISAKEALGSGLAMEVVAPEELDARALALATKIASWSPVATTGNRRVLDVVTGRVHDDTAALRLTSFEPEGALLANIERFVNRRTSAPRTRTLLFPSTPSKSWHVIRSWATRVVNRGIGRLATISNMRSTTSH